MLLYRLVLLLIQGETLEQLSNAAGTTIVLKGKEVSAAVIHNHNNRGAGRARRADKVARRTGEQRRHTGGRSRRVRAERRQARAVGARTRLVPALGAPVKANAHRVGADARTHARTVPAPAQIARVEAVADGEKGAKRQR